MIFLISYFLFFLHLIPAEQATTFNIVSYGAKGDGVTDNTEAIRKTLLAAANYSLASTVLIPAGDFLTGSLEIPSNVTFYLARNAILRASDNESLYSPIPSMTSDTSPFDFPFLLVNNSHNVYFQGEGLINGGANSPPGHLVREYQPSSNMLMPKEWNLTGCTYFSCRPKLLLIRHSHSIEISEITIANSAFWTVTVVESENILFDKVTILGDRRWPNNDGIDLINTRHVIIRNSNISTGDDSIAIVSHGPSSMFNITVENMDLQSTSAAIKVSAFDEDASGNMYNMTFRDIRITDSNRGICVAPRWGSGIISDILFEQMNIETRYFGLSWWGTAEPIYVTGLSMSANRHWTGKLRNIQFRNIVAQGEQGFMIRGNTSLLENISFENVSLTISRWSNVTEHPLYDYRPSEEPQLIDALVDGIFAQDINGLSLENIFIEFKAPKQKYYGQCLNLNNITQKVESNIQCRDVVSLSSSSKFLFRAELMFLFVLLKLFTNMV
ncbi:unnamed protein product [Rotaria socialis]|uniref:Rhamnogalacturonase A/B/Epimerase-like pectate lyase domain-containing protein n=1 Tax=Rotaria socialis TaxID=392032 RepID=A0A820QCI7_9BILA|nr:unnamed protein product [Rotaria socialis]CAF3389616.1 unnamed protein product [Rotaria socialis]CAF3473532.1 unnamed protein product [Rotaria socialis]CAF4418186.1 unnamed protein product [Rotaria socialis]CAF4485251.1 unnamed protein product [Rotaria socialis]